MDCVGRVREYIEREGAKGRGLTVKVTRESFCFFVES
jgi:hypothetical protein